MKTQFNRGFTLIELALVTLIIGILASIALPTYQGYIRRTACEDAKGVIVGAGNFMERFRAQNGSYAAVTSLGTHNKSPVDGTAMFTIALSNLAATTYTLTATGVGVMAGSGTLTLAHTGAKGGSGALVNGWTSCSGI